MAYLYTCPRPDCGRTYRIDVMRAVEYYGDWSATRCPDYPHSEERSVEVAGYGFSLFPVLRTHREFLRKLREFENLNWEVRREFS